MQRFFLFLCFSLILLSCKKDVRVIIVPEKDNSKETELLYELNQKKMRQEKVRIDAFVERSGWDMIETSTGIRYMIYKKGAGISPQTKDVVLIDFDIKLLDGTECYSSKLTGPESFKIDNDDVESGLHEALKYLRTGDKAKIILPSHRAFGLVGDQDKIPMNATVVYDIHLIRVIKNS